MNTRIIIAPHTIGPDERWARFAMWLESSVVTCADEWGVSRNEVARRLDNRDLFVGNAWRRKVQREDKRK
ncbi:MAG: hypothetical protein IIC12_00540 [Proteobacteria bacterium]|nr:hypothetical protein [Pseudomonadota bacterium]